MNKQKLILASTIFLSYGGLVLIGFTGNWWLSLGVLMVIMGHNGDRHN